MKKKYSILSNYKYMLSMLFRYGKGLWFLSLIEAVVNALVPLLGIFLPAMMISMLEKGTDLNTLVVNTVCMFIFAGIIYALSAALTQRNWYQFIYVRLGEFYVDLNIKNITIDYSLYEQDETQNDMMKAMWATNGNEDGIEGFYHYNVRLLTAILDLILYMFLIAKAQFILVLVLLGISIIQYLFYVLAKNYENKHREEQAKRNRHQWYFYNQSFDIASGKDIRLYQSQNWLVGLFDRYNKAFQKQLNKEKSLYALYDLIGLVLQVLRDGVCYIYLLYLLSEGMNLGSFLVYLGAVSGFGNWFSLISQYLAVISGCMVDINAYRYYMDLNKEEKSKGLKLERTCQGLDVVFDHVSFTYPNSTKEVLKDVSFHLKPNEKMALVGVNGAGKTTLVKLLCGFYEPTKGNIYINGINLQDLNKEDYIDSVSVLFQDSILFAFSIVENISGKTVEESNLTKVREAIKQSGLQEKIETLPKKENTYIGKELAKDGIQFSGGEKQKLLLARTIYKNAPLLLLDEPTAALDPLAEHEMYLKYNTLVKDKSSIFISHRLSSTRFCDRILFLENGEIAEEGSHEELMKKEGLYAHMFDVQSQYYKEGGENHE